MNDISDGALMAALRRQMTLAAAKQVVTTEQPRQPNTPGYKAQEVDFDEALDQQVGGGPATSPTAATSGAVASGRPLHDAGTRRARRDGNNVQVDRELLNMTRASGDFAAAQTALAAKFRLVRYAINECPVDDVDAQYRHQRQRPAPCRPSAPASKSRCRTWPTPSRRAARTAAVPPPRRRADHRRSPALRQRARLGLRDRRQGRRHRRGHAPFRRRYDPSHPDADRTGFVELPNVNPAEEMVDMVGASRAYQANLTAIGLIRDLVAAVARTRKVSHERWPSTHCKGASPSGRRRSAPAAPAGGAGGDGFGDALGALVGAVEETDSSANAAVNGHAQRHRLDVHDAMIALQRAGPDAAVRRCRCATSWCRPTRTSCGCRSRACLHPEPADIETSLAYPCMDSVLPRPQVVRAALTPRQLTSLGRRPSSASVGLVVGSAWYLNRPTYRVLFSDMDAEEAARVVERLKTDKVAYQLDDGGRDDRVPVSSASTTCACSSRAQGMPTIGPHRLRDLRPDRLRRRPSSSSTSTTGARSKASWRARSRRSARCAARASTSRWRRSRCSAPRAAGQGVGHAEAEGHAAAAAPAPSTASPTWSPPSVEGLRPEAVVIIDSFGRAARAADGRRTTSATARVRSSASRSIERDMGDEVVALLEPVVGVERVRVNVAVQLNGAIAGADRRKQYDPSRWSAAAEHRSTGGAPPSSAAAWPARAATCRAGPVRRPHRDAGAGHGRRRRDAALDRRAVATRTQPKLSNYEVEQATTHTIRPRGEVAKLSVAVLVDDEHVTTDGAGRHGQPKRKPRDAGGDAEAAEARRRRGRHRHGARRPGHGREHRRSRTPVDEPVAGADDVAARQRRRSGAGARPGRRPRASAWSRCSVVLRPIVRRVSPTRCRRAARRRRRRVETRAAAAAAAADDRGDRGRDRGAARREAADAGRPPTPVLTRRVATLANEEPENAAKLVRGWLTEENADRAGARPTPQLVRRPQGRHPDAAARRDTRPARCSSTSTRTRSS